MGAWEDSKTNSKDTPIDDMRDLFGGALQLSPEMATLVNGLYNTFNPHITEAVENGVFDIAKKSLGDDKALKIASSFGWATILGKDISDVYSTGKRHFNVSSELKKSFSDVLEADGKKESFNHLTKHNEIAQVENRKLMGQLNKEVLALATGLMTTVPQAVMKQMRADIRKAEDAEKGKIDKKSLVSNTLLAEEDIIKTKEKELNKKIQLAKNDSSRENNAVNELNARYQNIGDSFDNVKGRDRLSAVQEVINQQVDLEFAENIKSLEKEKTDFKEKTKNVFGTVKDLEAKYAKMENIGNPAMAFGQEMATNLVNKKSRNISKQTTAFDKIKKLRDSLWDDPESKKVDGKNIKDYVYSIFEQHQEDMGQGGIAKRYHEQFDYAVDKITTAITDGEMSPMALVNLVGERKIVKDKGKAIATREDVKAQIATQIEKLPAHFPVDPDTFLSEAPITIDDIKATIDGLSGIEKHFYISLMPEEVALKAGVEKDDYKVSVSEVKLHHGEMLAKGVLDMASKSDAQLKDELHFDEKEIKMIRELAPKAKEGDVKEVEEAQGKLGKHGIDSILLQDKQLWQDMVGKNTHLGDVYHTANDKLWTEREDEAKAEKEHIEDKKKHDDKEDKLDKKEHKAGDDISSKEAANDSNSPDSKVSRIKNHEKAFDSDKVVGF